MEQGRVPTQAEHGRIRSPLNANLKVLLIDRMEVAVYLTGPGVGEAFITADVIRCSRVDAPLGVSELLVTEIHAAEPGLSDTTGFPDYTHTARHMFIPINCMVDGLGPSMVQVFHSCFFCSFFSSFHSYLF